jgi:hypothetical protein
VVISRLLQAGVSPAHQVELVPLRRAEVFARAGTAADCLNKMIERIGRQATPVTLTFRGSAIIQIAIAHSDFSSFSI